MPDIVINVDGVCKMLHKLKDHKAPGPDGIPAVVLKKLTSTVAPSLCTIFRRSYSTSKVPKDWLRANVAPVFKKGDRTDPENYRAISLTCISCKMMEHIIASKLMRHGTNNDILYPLQHGFREKRSCELQLLGFVNDLLDSLDAGKETDVIVTDFSKAFDKVGHQRLLHKLDFYGVRGLTKKWISSFLSNRTQRVVLEGSSSTEVEVSSGVPQGSVLGPCLFLFYINALPDNMISSVRLFADDTIMYLTIDSQCDAS